MKLRKMGWMNNCRGGNGGTIVLTQHVSAGRQTVGRNSLFPIAKGAISTTTKGPPVTSKTMSALIQQDTGV
jgi:hypothetical protein